MEKAVRVLICDDHAMVREGLRSMLRYEESIDIVGEAEDVPGALAAIEQYQPEVVLLDIRLPGTSGLEACRAIRQKFPNVKVIILTVYEDEQYVFEALRAGASGYILKKIGDADLVKVIHSVHSGEVIVDPSLAGQIALRAAQVNRGAHWPGARFGLTERESEVLGAMAEGLSNEKIAEALFISEGTVKTHVKSILRKLNAKDRTQAVGIALREGIAR